MRILLIISLVTLSGCSWLFGSTFHNRALNYLDAREVAETQVPEGITLKTYDRYPVPAPMPGEEPPSEFRTPVPQALSLDASDVDTKITSLSEYRSQELNPRIERDGAGTEILRLDAGFAVSWARVADAISASNLKLTDLNRSLATFYLEAEDPEAEGDQRSWWGRLWGKKYNPVAIYQLHMNRSGEGVYLSLLKDSETLAASVLTHQVLTEIEDQLTK